MKIKHIITSGCSFSDKYTEWTWPHLLEAHVKLIDPSVTFDHRGMGHQGQELIQKKTSNAIMDALAEDIDPKEIAVLVMWSGNDRKTWYITNQDYINEIKKYWGTFGGDSWHVQFCNLKNNKDGVEILEFDNKNGQYYVQYNPNGGWYHSAWNHREPKFINDYILMTEPVVDRQYDKHNINSLHVSLENIVMLQNMCKLHGITFYQQYYMKHTYEDIDSFKDHDIINYLYDQLDNDTRVFPSIHEYTKPMGLTISEVDVHPNAEGHQVYFKDVLLPFLQKKNFFE
jgi:hypothetical protein